MITPHFFVFQIKPEQKPRHNQTNYKKTLVISERIR